MTDDCTYELLKTDGTLRTHEIFGELAYDICQLYIIRYGMLRNMLLILPKKQTLTLITITYHYFSIKDIKCG